jgi:serine/threonine protein kinase
MPLEPKPTVAAAFAGTYEISLVRKIADGGMGSLYEAELHGPRGFVKTVALKTILESYSNDDQFVDQFIGEAKLVADLVHQNICQVYQLGMVGQRYFIAMEYIGGVNLRQLMDRHREKAMKLPPELGVFIISRVCRGLEYAHGKRDRRGELIRVVHRDISPGNIMISTEGEVKLTDFGVAKARNLMRHLQEGKVRVGKLAYMSPEQARFELTDGRSDLFSLGAVMYELLTGRRLFAAETGEETQRNLEEKEIPAPRSLNPDIPEGVERILLRSLERDLERRYQSAGEMGYDLEYEIYHKGYGPTIVVLEKHLRKLFPELFVHGERRQVQHIPGTSGSFDLAQGEKTEADPSEPDGGTHPTVIARRRPPRGD